MAIRLKLNDKIAFRSPFDAIRINEYDSYGHHRKTILAWPDDALYFLFPDTEEWLKENKIRYNMVNEYIEFVCADDAMAFKLRWL